jgi:hypothetical protein
MSTCSHAAKWITCAMLFLAVTQLLIGCSSGSTNGGITIAQTDSTPPTITLGAGQPNGQNKTVSSGGLGVSLKLISKSDPLNLAVTAKDPESGVQTVQIWVNKTSTNCSGTICSTTGPGLLGNPAFESTSPQKHPGETTAESSILLEALDLTKEIPQQNLLPGGHALSMKRS